MVDIVQLVRTSDCGSGGRGFESHCPPKKKMLFCIKKKCIFANINLEILVTRNIL